MTISREARPVAIVDPSPSRLPWWQLKELIDTSELPADVSVEWMLDHARSSDGARP
ncbi:hypothetical protein [uncultured Sulfitobacter sp.]|uniref:hypothetical protein n=1 Tax=uncultured Sulfitobacter sp. TaxID=191468 RepID=UPI0026249519|nr:hypothetical protein [uncultured Sulfitobacter sp.]